MSRVFKSARFTPERIALLLHPLTIIKLNLRFAWISLDSVHWYLASGDARGARACLSKAREHLDRCEELVIDNVRLVPVSFLKDFFCESSWQRMEIDMWAHSGIAEGMASYQRCLKMVITI